MRILRMAGAAARRDCERWWRGRDAFLFGETISYAKGGEAERVEEVSKPSFSASSGSSMME